MINVQCVEITNAAGELLSPGIRGGEILRIHAGTMRDGRPLQIQLPLCISYHLNERKVVMQVEGKKPSGSLGSECGSLKSTFQTDLSCVSD